MDLGSHTDYIICDGSNGETQLCYYGSEKLNTSNTGVTVTGTLAATALSGDGSNLITGLSVGVTTTEKNCISKFNRISWIVNRSTSYNQRSCWYYDWIALEEV